MTAAKSIERLLETDRKLVDTAGYEPNCRETKK